MKKIIFIFFLIFAASIKANKISAHTQSLKEDLTTVTMLDKKNQQYILLLKPNSDQPKYLTDFF
jgi:hypothetical protein